MHLNLRRRRGRDRKKKKHLFVVLSWTPNTKNQMRMKIKKKWKKWWKSSVECLLLYFIYLLLSSIVHFQNFFASCRMESAARTVQRMLKHILITKSHANAATRYQFRPHLLRQYPVLSYIEWSMFTFIDVTFITIKVMWTIESYKPLSSVPSLVIISNVLKSL